MSKIDSYGYDDHLLSNSMLSAAITCPVKYKLMYVDGIRPDKVGFYWNSAFIGNVIHKAIELHDDDHEAIKGECWSILGSYFPAPILSKAKNLIVAYQDAIAATCKQFEQQNGRPCKAPEMTGFWKKNYAALTGFMEKLNVEMEASIPGGVFEEPFVDLMKRLFVCLENWKVMRIDAPIASEIVLHGVVGPEDARTDMVGTADRLEKRPGGRTALADFKTGKWAYDRSKTANSDQFGLYHRFLEQERYAEYGPPIEWCIYNLFTAETVRITPNEKMLEKFDNRLATNLRYYKQLKEMLGKVEVPTPAGSAFKTGCPCILSQTGDCNFVYVEESA